MNRSLALAIAAACLRRQRALRAGRRYAARQSGALLVGSAVQLDRLLFRHQRRLWLGPLELERSDGSAPIREGSTPPARCSAGSSATIGRPVRRARRRDRCRLDEYQRQHRGPRRRLSSPTAAGNARPNRIGSAPRAAASATRSAASALCHRRRRLRRHQSLAIDRHDATQTKFGWTAGGGVEYSLDRNWSAKVEYLHLDLGTASLFSAASGASTLSVPVTDDLVRAGINYHW